jgi:hypothetical protein
MTPRNYQSKAITEVVSGFSAPTSKVVLAAATGSGKTEIAIMLVSSFVKSNFGKVLVIAHHTNVIKDNFCQRLAQINPDFTWSQTSTDVDCFVAIRSSIVNLDLSQFSLVIVDEAHQNYFADTIQSRIGCVNHQVLLTATPSKFVADGVKYILPIARLDIPNEFFARLNFRIVNADVKIDSNSYNDDRVLKSGIMFSNDEVKSSVDSVLPHIADGKKLFICRDIKHAQLTAQYLTSVGIDSVVSDSKSDPDSIISNKFKSGDIQSLVVVDRMRLGYSDNNLYYTIDMSFTHNPDTIHQMMSRSNRGNQLQNKFYIKVTNNTLNALTRVMVSISISLMKKENLLSFNGKNFAGLQIPVVKQTSTGVSSSRKSASASSVSIPDFGDIQNFFDVCDFADADVVLNQLTGVVKRTYESCFQSSQSASSWNEFRTMSRNDQNWIQSNGFKEKLCVERGWKIQSNKTVYDIQEVIASAKKYDSASDYLKSEPSKYKWSSSQKITHLFVYSSGLTTAQTVEKRQAEAHSNKKLKWSKQNEVRKAKRKLSSKI